MSGVRAPYEELLFPSSLRDYFSACQQCISHFFVRCFFFLPSRFWKYCSEKEEREASNSEGWHYLSTDRVHPRRRGFTACESERPGASGRKKINRYL